jgi:hypothetical protein
VVPSKGVLADAGATISCANAINGNAVFFMLNSWL